MTAYAQKNYVRPNYTEYVNSYIGSLDLGNVFVGASVPFGALQVGPMNIPDHSKGNNSGYHYDESIICGFAQTHLSGTGCADLCDVILMPYSGTLRTARGTKQNIEGAASSHFSHANETVSPDFYSVKMDNGVKAEMTATERTGIYRFTYTAGGPSRLLVDLKNGCEHDAYESWLKRVDDYTLEGYRFVRGWAPKRKVFFTMRLSQPIKTLDVFCDDTPCGRDELQGPSVKGVATFADDVKEVMVKVSISSVSTANAALNMQTELPAWDMEAVRRQAVEKWNAVLSTIDVEGGRDDKATFYSALYHTMINPSLYCDVNGEFRGIDEKIYRNPSWQNYTIFSLWDTYRSVHPLYNIIMPDRVPDMLNSMLSIYDQQGYLPIWPIQSSETNCMDGYSSMPILADACLKGIKGVDYHRALEAILASARDTADYVGLGYVLRQGYIPADKMPEATSIGLEFAIGDWAVAMMAKKMGRDDVYRQFLQRGKYYANYWNAATGFMHPKMSDGTWKSSYLPWHFTRRQGDFTEGDGLQYTFYVPQHPEGLIALAGGDDRFVAKLDTLLTIPDDGEMRLWALLGQIGQLVMGNEPCAHMPYLYVYAGRQWKTAELVRRIQRDFYKNEPRGMEGNDDCGALSAWHVLSALGFYQVSPAGGALVFGSPLFTKATIHVGKGKDFTITARGNSPKNVYIQSARLNGQPWPYTYITYEQVMQGGTLEFVMGPRPNKRYGAAKEYRPKTDE